MCLGFPSWDLRMTIFTSLTGTLGVFYNKWMQYIPKCYCTNTISLGKPAHGLFLNKTWFIWLRWNFHKQATKVLKVIFRKGCDPFSFSLERYKGTEKILFWRQKINQICKHFYSNPYLSSLCYRVALSDMTAKSILESVGALYSLFTAAVIVVPGLKMSLESTGFSYLMKVSRKKIKYSNWIWFFFAN